MTQQIQTIALAGCVARLLPFGLFIFIGMQTAEAKQCSAAMPPHPQGHWSYRIIDERKCWYQGENQLSKSLLEWPQQPSALSPFSETQARLDEETPPVKQPISASPEKSQNQSDPEPHSFEARWRALETTLVKN
jgi:hypothetical protein